jgi:2-polyprenyl-3-methyl-5-hydroxy-6-metoxy-1,4-benzoquinol methylase
MGSRRDEPSGEHYGLTGAADAPRLFALLSALAERPAPFDRYCSRALWNDPHISVGMLEAHLDPTNEWASVPEDRIRACVDWMVRRLGIGAGTRVCDFGCGPGLWTIRFAEAGADVTGLDLSERSIAYARNAAAERGLGITYILGDYLECSLDQRFDVVTMIHGDFSVLSPSQAERMLGVLAAALAPGGVVALDVASPAAYSAATEQRLVHSHHPDGGFLSPEPHHQFHSTFRYPEVSLVAERYTVVEPTRVLDLTVWNRCYDLDGLTRLLGSHGFAIEGVYADFGGADLTEESLRIAVLARRAT